MATNQTTTKPATTPKAKREPVKLGERIKQQLNAQVLRGKVTLDELSDLEQHIKKLAGFLGAA